MGLDSKPPQAPCCHNVGAFRVQIPCWGTLCSGFRVKKVHLYRFRLRISKRFIQFWGSVLGAGPTFCAPEYGNFHTSPPKETYPDPLPKAARKPPGANKTRIAGQRRGLTRQWSSLRRTEGAASDQKAPTDRRLPTSHVSVFFLEAEPPPPTTTTSSAAAADLKKKIW